MLRTLPTLDVLRHEIRRRVCTHCRWRPAGSESLLPDVPRPCEADCPVFVHLPHLQTRAVLADPMLRSRREMLHHRIHELCRAPPGMAAAPGTVPRKGSCPLTYYRKQVVDTVLDMVGRS